MRRLRILLLTDEMEVGGTQRQIVYLAKNIDQQRFEPNVLFFRNTSYLVNELRDSRVPVKCIEKNKRIDLQFYLTLRRELKKERYDVIHCFSFTGELWGALANYLVSRAVLITSVRNVYDWYSRTQWWLKRWIAIQSYRVIANSKMGAMYAGQKMKLSSGIIKVVYNGTELRPEITSSERSAIRLEFCIGSDVVMGLFAGRLVPQKNIFSLLRAVSRLSIIKKKFVLFIAGDGPLRLEVETSIARLGIADQARVLGNRDDIPRLIDASDFVVMPSLREGLSNVILEAMAGGKPVVASNVGGNPELVIDRVNGFLYPCGDDNALAACLRRMINDEKLRRNLGEAGRRRAKAEFSIRQMVRTMETIYNEGVAGLEITR
jgi:glycosyltransferase involved in cell wall biosynthesis